VRLATVTRLAAPRMIEAMASSSARAVAIAQHYVRKENHQEPLARISVAGRAAN